MHALYVLNKPNFLMNYLPLPLLARARIFLVIEYFYFSIFFENLKMADRRNELQQKYGGSAVHGI